MACQGLSGPFLANTRPSVESSRTSEHVPPGWLYPNIVSARIDPGGRVKYEMRIQHIWLAAVVCLICLGNLSAGHAQSTDELELLILQQAPSEPREVRVGVQIHQIKFVNQKAENFGVVGTLRLEWEDPNLAFDAEEAGREFKVYQEAAFRKFTDKNSLFYPGFVIQNQQERRFKQQAAFIVFSSGQAYYLEQFSTVLQAPDFNFTQFPFDTQKFFVHVVSNYPENFVKYVELEEFSELGEKLGEEEWLLTDYWTEVSAVEGLTGLQSSRFSFGFKGGRHLEYYIVRIFVPLLIFVLVSWATFFLEEYRKRIDIAGANLLIFVAFNFAISGDLPRLGYMTFLDFILVAMFVLTGLIIVFNVGLRRLKITGREELAHKIDDYALKWIYPVSYVVVISWVVYKFLYKPALVLAG